MINDCAPITLHDIDNIRFWLRIGIFGPYKRRKGLLVRGRDYLRKGGFPFTFLVENFPSGGFHEMREKSDHYLELMDAVVFVLLFRGDNSGVSIELDDFVREERYLSQFSAVALEVDEKGKTPETSLLSKNIAKGQLEKLYFGSTGEFLEALESAADRYAFRSLTRINSSQVEKMRFLQAIRDNATYRERLCDNHQNCASYVCLDRCRPNCRVFHLCYTCVLTAGGHIECARGHKQVFRICPPNVSIPSSFP